MGTVIYFDNHQRGQKPSASARQELPEDSLIPVQLALDEYDIEKCFARLASFGRCSVFPRANPEDSGKILFLVRIGDAITLNQYLLDLDVEDSQAMAHRIDHIQMLENCEASLLCKAWDRIGLEGVIRAASESDPGGAKPVRQ